MLDRLDLLRDFEIMEFINRFFDGIAALVAVLTERWRTVQQQSKTNTGSEDPAREVLDESLHCPQSVAHFDGGCNGLRGGNIPPVPFFIYNR